MPRDEGEVVAALRALPSGRKVIPRANARREAARAMRERGMTLAAIGHDLGITRERVRQLTRGIDRPRIPRLREREPDPRALEMLRAGDSVAKVAAATRNDYYTIRAWRDLACIPRWTGKAYARLDAHLIERFRDGRHAARGEVQAIARAFGKSPQDVSNRLSCLRLYDECDPRRAARVRALAKSKQSS